MVMKTDPEEGKSIQGLSCTLLGMLSLSTTRTLRRHIVLTYVSCQVAPLLGQKSSRRA
jgi:hypothetical protein